MSTLTTLIEILSAIRTWFHVLAGAEWEVINIQNTFRVSCSSFWFVSGEERFAAQPAALRPPEAGLHLGGESSGAQKQQRLPVSDGVSGEGQLVLGRSSETGNCRAGGDLQPPCLLCWIKELSLHWQNLVKIMVNSKKVLLASQKKGPKYKRMDEVLKH